MHSFLLVVLLGCVSVRAEVSCPRFEYDRLMMEKLVRIEDTNSDLTETIQILEASFKSLKEDFIQFPSNVDREIKDQISIATESMLRRPNVEFDDWNLLYRATSGIHFNVYEAWNTGKGATTVKPTDMKRSNDRHYLNMNLAKKWDNGMSISKVRFSLFENELEVAFIVFDAAAATRHTWFSFSRIQNTSWPALFRHETFNYFSSIGHPEVKRRFFINLNYGGCPKDKGYVAIVDTGVDTERICEWDVHPIYPQFVYSKINGPTIWERLTFGRADYAAIYVQ